MQTTRFMYACADKSIYIYIYTRIKARAKARAFHSSWGALPPNPPQSSILKFSLGYGSLRRSRPSLECFLTSIQNRRQNESKIFPKSFKNHQKIMQQNLQKSTPGKILKRPGGALGVLGDWYLLWASRSHLGPVPRAP